MDEFRTSGRNANYREGDRSEDLLQYVLRRFAFAIPVARTEDFGVFDFACTISKPVQNLVEAKEVFFVQSKSSAKDFVLTRKSANWILYQLTAPLLYALVNKDQQFVEIYSTWRLPFSLLMNVESKYERVLLEPNVKSYGSNSYLYDEPNKILKVALYKPVLKVSISQIEAFQDIAISVLRKWFEVERLNLMLMKLTRGFFYGFHEWETNTPPDDKNNETYFTFGLPIDDHEYFTTAYLTAQCVNYHHLKQKDKIQKIVEIIKVMPDKYKNSMTKFFESGNYISE